MSPIPLALAKTFRKHFLGAALLTLTAFSALLAQDDISSLAAYAESVQMQAPTSKPESGALANAGLDSLAGDPPVRDSLSAMSPDSLSTVSGDSLVPNAADSSVVSVPSATAQVAPESVSVPRDSVSPSAQAVSTAGPVKNVLYLGGGDHSPWFHLGMLYALEEFGVPVDSVVGTSWGALVGYLWAKGMPLDDIQRFLLDPSLATVIGVNELASRVSAANAPPHLSVSLAGLPSFRYRFTLSADSVGNLYVHSKDQKLDSARVEGTLARLRLQETLTRLDGNFKIPFATLGCDARLAQTPEAVFASLPLAGNESSGELCPVLAFPLEDSPAEIAVLSVAMPVRREKVSPAWLDLLQAKAVQTLNYQPGVIIRPHFAPDSSRQAWIQAGYSAAERRRADLGALRRQAVPAEKPVATDIAASETSANPQTDVPALNAPAVSSNAQKSWRNTEKLAPVFDSLSSEHQAAVASYWDTSLVGMEAPRAFAYGLLQRPSYDSVEFTMEPRGEVLVNAQVRPTYDIAFGGFGSSAFGPNAFAELSLSYVNQLEYDISFSGFYGGNTYGFGPHLLVSRLWNRDWSFEAQFNSRHLQPLKSFNRRFAADMRVDAERRSALSMAVHYQMDSLQQVSLNFQYAHRTFLLNEHVFSSDEFETYPVSPSLSYVFGDGRLDPWFAQKGFRVSLNAGLQSISFSFGMNEVIPIYWKAKLDAQYSGSPTSFLSFTAGLVGVAEMYHKEGYGYVYPESFDYVVLDNFFRSRIESTPWSTEWVDPNRVSHHYALARVSGGLHYHGSGLWIFGAYYRDFEGNPTATLGCNRIALEPALRLSYKSVSAYFGITNLVDFDSYGDLSRPSRYRYFVRIGNYEL